MLISTQHVQKSEAAWTRSGSHGASGHTRPEAALPIAPNARAQARWTGSSDIATEQGIATTQTLRDRPRQAALRSNCSAPMSAAT